MARATRRARCTARQRAGAVIEAVPGTECWFAWAIRSQLEPIKRVARTLQRYWDQIENYFRHRITNAGLEAINTKIQGVKRRSRGFRSRERFTMAIYFHCGRLDLYPVGAAIRL